MLAEAKSLFQDPSREDFKQYIYMLNENAENCTVSCKSDEDKNEYVRSVLSLTNNNNILSISQDCTSAVESLHEMWGRGINDAGYELSRMYYHGVCVDINLDKSQKLLSSAAEDGYVPAQKLLGKSYWSKEIQGKLYDKDIDKSAFWLLKSAKAGDAESAAMLSAFYRKGISFEKDPEQSFYWADKAFNSKYGSGSGVYTSRLAEYYENGYGVDRNLVKAYIFYDLTGTSGIEGRDRVSKQMSDTQIQEAIEQSRAWQEEHRTFVPSYYGLQHQSDGSYR